MEGRSNRDRRAESRQAPDVLDRLGGRLQYLARSVDACVCEPGHRRHARLLAKPTAQRPSSPVCRRGERAEVEAGRSSRTPAAARANAAVQIDTNRAPRACAARTASSTVAETVASTSSYPGMISVSARLSPSRPAGVLTVNPEPGSDADRPSAQTVRR